MKLLIFGAGYVGIALLSALQNSSYHLVATTTTQEKIKTLEAFTPDAKLVKGNDKETLKVLIKECESIIILIAPNKSGNYEETYLITAKTIAEILRERKTPFYLLYTSSTSVYQGQDLDWVTEEACISPLSKDAQILPDTENLYLSCANDAVKTCILRLGGIYGPGRELERRAHRLAGKELPGSGNEPTNHIHLQDIVLAIQFCLKSKLEGIYNIVNDDHPTRKELYEALCKQLDIPCPIWTKKTGIEQGCMSKVSNNKIYQQGFLLTHPLLR